MCKDILNFFKFCIIIKLNKKEGINTEETPANIKKPKLSIDGQVDYLKTQKGITFQYDEKNEEYAKNFLMEHNYYFKLKAYAKLYSKIDGKYQNLDFACLQELSTLDAELRKIILKMCVDIEHFLKVRLLKDISENPKEDGYSIINEFFALYPECHDKITNKSNRYTKNLIEYLNENEFAIWNTIELMTFHDIVSLVKLYYEKYPAHDMGKILCCLFSVRCIRNAAAHNNCLLNTLARNFSEGFRPTRLLIQEMSQLNVSVKTLDNKMSTIVIHDMVAVFYTYEHIVTSDKSKEYTYKEASKFFSDRLFKRKYLFENNALILTNFEFLKKVVDFFEKSHIIKE